MLAVNGQNMVILTMDGCLTRCSRRIDIRQLDFVALKAAGYRGAVVDKDNCLVRLFSSLDWEREFLNLGIFFRRCLIATNSFQN